VIQHEIDVPVERDAAFDAFADNIGDWWPIENTFARVEGAPERLVEVTIDNTAGGQWFERWSDGRAFSWGRVLRYERPTALTLTWQIRADGRPEPDPDKASTVEIRFASSDQDISTVTIVHRDFEHHGDEASAIWREAMDSDEGWPKFLRCYREFVTGKPS